MRITLVFCTVLIGFSGCNCGFEAARDCHWKACSDLTAPDAAVSSDAGLSVPIGMRDGGHSSVDSGTVFDAGSAVFDAGSTAFDAGWSLDAGFENCFPGGPQTQQDIISVHGHAGAVGYVDFSIRGYSAGFSGGSGIQRFTGNDYQSTNLPPGIWDTGLWMWSTSGSPIVVGQEYIGDNVDQYSGPHPYVNFRVLGDGPSATCPPGAGTGRFTFSRFDGHYPGLLVEGVYAFSCPPSSIEVVGCFHFSDP